MKTRAIAVLPCLLGLALIPVMSCAVTNDVNQATSGCDEFTTGGSAVGNLNLNATVKAFTQASSDLKIIGDGMRGDIKTACINIAKDLGEQDQWSGDDSDSSIANDQKTGACDVAAAKIGAIMTAGASAGADFALEISGGECTIDADLQASCEATCKADQTCTEASTETRCTPAEVTGECDATCNALSVCEGRVDAAANCMGKCESDCEGTCAGELNGTTEGGCAGMCEGTCDGVATPAGGMASCTGTCVGKCTQPNPTSTCHGKCASRCNGTCKGECALDENASLNCGATVNCKGGCSTTYVAPKCETELKPPVCTGDANCQASCAAEASAHEVCTGPSVTLVCNVNATADIPKLKATLEANLPNLLLAADTKGQLALRAIQKVAATGQAVVNASGNLSAKDVSCAGTAAAASVTAAASMSVSVSASTNVATTCSSNAS